jgi:hypothetical protein
VRLVRNHIRPILYGTWPEKAPLDCTGAIYMRRSGKHKKGDPMLASMADNKRHLSWAWMTREFLRTRQFRMSELCAAARQFHADHGHPKGCTLIHDMELLKAFQQMLYKKSSAESRHLLNPRVSSSSGEIAERKAATSAKMALLAGVCPMCGDPLPCDPCDMPDVMMDGRGGLVAVPRKEPCGATP